MRKKKIYRIIAFYLIINLLAEIISPTVALALTSGPAQPEMSSFEPVSTSEMVDLFSGDFNYNIPLLDVEGYPVNISYHANITSDQEASWVGLGWNINPGTINRNMRGIPDDFSGDAITKEINMKPNRTFGVSVGRGKEIVGFGGKGKISKSVSFGINYNNYTGLSFEMSLNLALSSATPAKMPFTGSLGMTSGADGLTIAPSISYIRKLDKNENMTGQSSIGTSFNSRAGLKALTLYASVSESTGKAPKGEENTSESRSRGIGYTLPISFGRPSYIPQINTPMKNVAVTLSFKYGTTAQGTDAHWKFGGYYSQQKLAENTTSRKAYGYLNLQDADAASGAMLDFNRDKDGPFGEHTSILPLTNLTYDMYNVSGQGIGGTFRPYRNDVGYVYDPFNYSMSDSYSLGAELAAAKIVKLGVDVLVTDVSSRSGKWNDNNAAKDLLKYRKVNQQPGFEPSFIKQAGELNVDADPALYDNIRTEEPVRPRLTRQTKFEHEVKAELESDDVTVSPSQLSPTNYRTKRQNRNQYLSYVKRSDLEGSLSKYLLSQTGTYGLHDMGNQALAHHIGEITTVKPDGSRYIYGIANYNIRHREVSFNASTDVSAPEYENTQHNETTGLVGYTPNTDNSKNNPKGLDNFFSATEIPPYANAYLLTSVLSADYIDITGDGPSADDYGTYTKFTYKRTADSGNSYKWRIPFEKDRANFNEGIKALPYDDQGNYLYGEKEIRFLEKIETKNFIAIFETAPRKDGFGVYDENGGPSLAANPLQVLKKIILYSKPDYALNGANATPVKTVNFIYDYSLCPGVPNNHNAGATPPYELANQSGKLTLKQIYFTYGKSIKAKLSPYKFDYGTYYNMGIVSTHNPGYNIKAYDRWGMYKSTDNPGSFKVGAFGSSYLTSFSKNRTNSDFPYVNQNDIAGTNKDAAAWQLSKIILPSGGSIDIEYEADDYAYVQDKKAMQMFQLTNIDISNQSHPDMSNSPYIHDLSHTKNILFFKLKKAIPVSTPNAVNIFRQTYLKDIEYLYFRANMRVSNSYPTFPKDRYDDVSGYSKIFASGLSSISSNSAEYQYGWIQLKNVCQGDNKDGSNCIDANPMSKAAWQYARIHCQREAMNFNNDPDPNISVSGVILGLADVAGNVVKGFMSANATLKASGIGKDICYKRSWIRLNTPDGFKMGGGSRVKRLSLNDNWKTNMFATGAGTNQKDSDYGQVYEYTTTDPETGAIISSGVAQYEPGVGGDENPFKTPIAPRNREKQEKILAPDDFQYQEEPIGESIYPSANIGYSKVTVKNLPRYVIPGGGTLAVKRHATGKVVYEYYTARDFPVIANRTALVPMRGRSILGKLLKFNVKDHMTAAQGFRIIFNDMHGKLKSQFVYAEGKPEAISGTEYKFKTNGQELLNKVTVINKDGSIAERTVGVDYDFVEDFREQETESVTLGVQVNMYLFNVGPIPAILPPVIPQFNREHVRFRSATATKIINKYGLLDKVIVHDLGSQATTQYLAYDGITGDVLLTRTNTGFDDNTYSLKYPAHFAYEGMSAAYKGTGILIKDVATGSPAFVNASGLINPAHDYYQFVHPGDVFMVYDNGVLQSNQLWAHRTGSNIYLINASGANASLTGTGKDLRIYRSGRRNMQTIPVGAVTTFYNPLDGDRNGQTDASLPYINESFGVLQSSAIEFSDKWQTFCECGITPGGLYNPYNLGVLGNWRKKKEYAFLGLRKQTKVNNNSDIRKDGTLENYSPFWMPNAGSNWIVPNDLNGASPKWTWVNEASKYSTNGMALEDKDALGRYSSAYLGYNYSLVSAMVANSKYKQSGFDSFEDYGFGTCANDHMGFRQHAAKVTETQAHTGKKSIMLLPASPPVLVTKIIEPCP